MNKIFGFSLTFVFAIVPITWGQSPIDNFKLEDKNVYWQKIYSTEQNFEQFVSAIKSSGKLKNIQIEDNRVFGYTRIFPTDPKGAGYSCGKTRIYVCSYDIQGFVVIDFKTGMYRITFKQITLKNNTGGLNPSLSRDKPFEKFALNGKKEKFSNHFTKSPHIIYDYTFSKEFEIKQLKETGW